MKKASSLLLSLVVFISSAPREGLTQVFQSVSFIGVGIAPFALESYMDRPIIKVRGASGRDQQKTREPASPYSTFRLNWDNISPVAGTDIQEEIGNIRNPLKPRTRKRPLPEVYANASLGDFDANLHRLVYAERSLGERMMDKVGDYGLTLQSLMSTPEQDEVWDRPYIVAERREEELTGKAALIGGITEISTGGTTIHSVGTASSYNAAADNRIESVDITTEFFGVLRNRIQVAQDIGSRFMRTASADSSYGSALFILNEAKFRNKLGETRFNLNYERYEPGYFAPLKPEVLTDRHGFTAGMTHKFNDKITAGISLKGSTETIHTDNPFSIKTAAPGVNLTLQPFAGSRHELLKNFQISASAEHRKRTSSHGRINDRRDMAYLTLQNQYKGLTFLYQYGRTRNEYPRFDFVRNEQRHRIRLDYDLQFKDLDINPFLSFDVIAPENATSQEEIRIGMDLGKEIAKRYQLRAQVYSGVHRQAGLNGHGRDVWPIMGMDLTLNLAPDCYLIGSFMMTVPYYGTTHPAAAGDVKFTMKF